MEEIKNQKLDTDGTTNEYSRWENEHRRGKILGGLLIVAAGSLFLAREMGAVLPRWLFSWQMILIAIGFYMCVKHSFKNAGGIIMMLIGGAFILRDYYRQYEFAHYFWPVAIIIFGVYVILRPKANYRHRNRRRWERHQNLKSESDKTGEVNADDYIEVSAVFGSVKKNIISKTFKGGEVNSVFGGTEVNFMHADISGTVELEVNSVFGGTTLIVPAHWEVVSKCEAVFGSVDDKRPAYKDMVHDGRVLIVKGEAVFGGIEIKSY